MNTEDFDDFSLMRVSKPKYPKDTVVTTNMESNNLPSKGDKMTDALTEHFDKILDLAGGILEIRKMKIQSDAILSKMAEDRKSLVAEAEAYAKKRNADTKSVVDRMNIVRLMMKDFYEANSGSITSEDFRIIITETINQMSKL